MPQPTVLISGAGIAGPALAFWLNKNGYRVTIGDAVEATLTDGTKLSVDLVVGADGPHSTVRRLVFGREEQFAKPLGGYNAWFTAPDAVGLDGWYLMYQAPGLNASMRPSHEPSMCKAGLAFRSEPIAYDAVTPTSNGLC